MDFFNSNEFIYENQILFGLHNKISVIHLLKMVTSESEEQE